MININGLENWIDWIGGVFIVVFATIEVGIDLFCHNQRSYRDTAANIAIAIIYQFTNIAVGYAIAFTGLKFFSQFTLSHIAINVWTTILAIAIADFIYYWEHQTEHRIRFFWAYHNVHHSSRDYNLTVASRLSWVEACFLWIFYIPMALLGFDPLQILIAVQINALYQIWIHTQKIGCLGVVERIINTPALHQVHHGSNSIYIDKNFGGILVIWDRLFGTYRSQTEAVVYGLTENINTNNPLKINTVEYRRIGKCISKSKSWKDIWYSIFGTLKRRSELKL